EQALTALHSAFGTNAAAAATLNDLFAEVHELRAAANRATEAAIAAIKAEARAKVLAHAPVHDFDSLLERVTALTPGKFTGFYYPVTEGPNAPTIQALRNVLMHWQNYLTQTSRGEFDSAATTLQQLAGSSDATELIVPRSALLAF